MTSKQLIQKHEGLKLKPYTDTIGILTIGYGRNLQNGISQTEAEYLFENDYQDALQTALSLYPRFVSLSKVRQAVLVNMAFNLGLSRLRGFVKFFAALEARDFRRASDEMLDSKWSGQVGVRAQQLAFMMTHDKWPAEED